MRLRMIFNNYSPKTKWLLVNIHRDEASADNNNWIILQKYLLIDIVKHSAYLMLRTACWQFLHFINYDIFSLKNTCFCDSSRSVNFLLEQVVQKWFRNGAGGYQKIHS